MMKARHILLYSMGALLLMTACQNNDNDGQDGWNGEIRLQAVQQSSTRATTNVQGSQFYEGQEVAVFINEHDQDPEADNKTDYPQPLKFTVSDDNSTLTVSNAEIPVFPHNIAHGVDVYALYPSWVEGVGTFTVRTQQASDDDYMASDLMYGVAPANIRRTATVIPLSFTHQLAKVVVRLEAGSGSRIFSGATIELMGLKPSVPITKCDLTGMTLGEATGETTDIVLTDNYNNDANHPEDNGCAAVIVPQEKSKGALIRITQMDGTQQFFRLHESVTFEAGKVYTYIIYFYMSSLSVRSEVTSWTDSDLPMNGTFIVE